MAARWCRKKDLLLSEGIINEAEREQAANISNAATGCGASMECGTHEEDKQIAIHAPTEMMMVVDADFWEYPGDQEIINAIKDRFNVPYGDACEWILEAASSLRKVMVMAA